MSAFLLQFRNPKASLHTRLSYLIKHLQKKGDRHCQEFYRALQINAEQLYNDLPSRKILSKLICTLNELWISLSMYYEISFQMICSDYLRVYIYIYIFNVRISSDWNFKKAVRDFDCIALLVGGFGMSKNI